VLIDSYELDTTFADEIRPEVITPMSVILFHACNYAFADMSTHTCNDCAHHIINFTIHTKSNFNANPESFQKFVP
jgi:hypothetical protein